jgi:hypothetical protein
LDVSRSSPITRVIDSQWLQGWGAFLCLSGVLVVISTVTANRPLERLSLRFLSVACLVYLGWAMVAVPPTQAMFTGLSCLSLVGLAEVRVAVLHVAMRTPVIILDNREDDR